MSERRQPSRSARAIRAVTLDVGGTLIEPWPSVGHVYLSVARRFGCPDVEPSTLTSAFVEAWKQRSNFDYSRESWRALVETSFAGEVSFSVNSKCFAAIYDEFAEASAWRVHPEVEPCLAGLKSRGLKVAYVSNWDERLEPLLRRLPVLSGVSTVVTSHRVGCTKPAPEIFQAAANELSEEPSAILHVGDSEEEDVVGARKAGFSALWLRRSGQGGLGTIQSLQGILDWLDSSNPSSK